MHIAGLGLGKVLLEGMGMNIKVATHVGMGTGTGLFPKNRYGDGYSCALPRPYPLSSLITLLMSI